MEALVVDRDKVWNIVEIPKPHFNERQALVKLMANDMCGSDLKLIHQEFKYIISAVP